MGKLKDETGHVYTRLTVLSRAQNNNQKKPQWLCKCACGNLTTVAATSLRSGVTQSCGCFQQDVTTLRSTIHGESKRIRPSRLYKCWQNMVHRARSRGLAVSADWTGEGGFVAFQRYVIERLGEHPGKGWSLARIDNKQSFVPGNLRYRAVVRTTQYT